MTADRPELWHRVLILAPIGRDAELISALFNDAGIESIRCRDAADLCAHLSEGAGAAILAEEALDPSFMADVFETLEKQPPWSDMPVLILTGQPSEEPGRNRSFAALGKRASVTLVDRPVRMKTLVTTVESLLRFRSRQYEIRNLMESLEDRINERDRFLAILGHELRNPLAAIMLATQMADPDDGRLETEHVDRIQQQSRHLTRLVNDLLDLSRVTSGKIVLRHSVVNLCNVIEQSLQTVKGSMGSPQLEVRLHLPEHPVHVQGDTTRLDQIFSNVLTNAIKYTPEGGAIDITLEQTDHDGVITVSDTGVGIAPERIGSIFELFAQAENAIGRAQGGMGIGLALVRNLVALHEGKVSVTSNGVGKGSTFTITLPLATDAEVSSAPKKRSKHREHRVDGDGARRVVIVEDNPDLRDLLKLKLRRLGHTVESAPDGKSGLELLLAEKPDVAFVDIGLPGIDGYEIAQKVRAELGSSIVLVALSGFGQPDDKRRALEAGFDQHLTKPAEIHELEAVLSISA